MAETVNGGNNQPQAPKEMSMEIRLLLAFLLMGVVMFVTPYFFKSPPAAQKGEKAQTTQEAAGQKQAEEQKNAQPAPTPAESQKPQTQKSSSPASTAAAAPAATSAGTPQQAQPLFIIDTDLFRVAFSNQGATVRSWQLKKFKGNDNKPLELMNTAADLHPFSLHFPDQKPTSDVNKVYYTQKPDPDGLGVTYEFSDGHTVVRKIFRFQKDKYLSDITTEVTVDGKPISNLIEWRGGFGDLTVSNAAGHQRALFFNQANNKLVEQNAKTAKNGPVSSSGNYSFAGMADTYFAAVFLPADGSTMHQVTFSDTVRTALEEKAEPFPGIAVSNGVINRFSFFVGPKDLDLLGRVNPKLKEVVNFGWMSVLAKPLFLIVNWFNDGFVHNYGWAIVLVTIVINFMLFPLKLANMKSMRKMQALQPQIKQINEKYKNVKLNDPRKGEQNAEVMALYKQHGVNPLGGCVPMALQIPFFFAFYEVFTVSVQMRGASWLWVADLSQPEPWAIKILPITMVVSQFLMQKMTPQTSPDPNQQRMMMLMPLIFGFMFYNLPSGLVLYYLTSNLVSMGQQWFFNHTAAAEEAARSVEPKKKGGRK
ncbi:MAG TPA: membrane protein insertase YidC [Bryobacteraceae bacterium]|nr:membrane protein insertase YidC [Bryobacteraceae bacterium]